MVTLGPKTVEITPKTSLHSPILLLARSRTVRIFLVTVFCSRDYILVAAFELLVEHPTSHARGEEWFYLYRMELSGSATLVMSESQRGTLR